MCREVGCDGFARKILFASYSFILNSRSCPEIVFFFLFCLFLFFFLLLFFLLLFFLLFFFFFFFACTSGPLVTETAFRKPFLLPSSVTGNEPNWWAV